VIETPVAVDVEGIGYTVTEHVIVTDADGIRTIRMNRPDKKNALTLAMYEAMTAALEGANRHLLAQSSRRAG